MPTYEKAHFTKTLAFDGGSIEGFDVVAAVGAGVANTVSQAPFPLAQRSKIYKVVVTYSAIAAVTGTHLFNIAVGTAAEAAANNIIDFIATSPNNLAAAPSAISSPGMTLFAADQQLTSAANTPAIFIPTTFDTIYDTGTLLTLRVVTPASTGSITNLKVLCFVKPLDAGPSFTGLYPF